MMKNIDPKRFYEIGKKTWTDFNKQFPTYDDFQKLMDEDPENIENFDILVRQQSDPKLYKALVNPDYNPEDDPIRKSRNLLSSGKNSNEIIRSPYYNAPTNNLSYAPLTVYADNTYKLPLKPEGKEVPKEDYGPASPKDVWSDVTAIASQFTKTLMNAAFQPLLESAREGAFSPNWDRGGRGMGTLRTPTREVERANRYETYQNSTERLVAYKDVMENLSERGKSIDKFLGHDPTKTSFFGDVFGGIGTSGAIFLTGVVTRNPLIPLMVGAQAEAVSYAQDVWELNKDIPLADRVSRSKKAEFFGMGVGWTEALPMGKLGEYATNKIGKSLFKEGMEEGVEKSFKGYVGTGFDKLFKKESSDLGMDLTFGKMNVTHAITEEMMDEGLQEVLQGTLEEGGKALGLVDNYKFDLASVLYQGVVGSVAGGVMGGTTAKMVNSVNTETRQANNLNKAKIEILDNSFKKGEIKENNYIAQKEELKKQTKEEKIKDLIDYRIQGEIYNRSKKAVAHVAKNGWTNEPEVQKMKTYVESTDFFKEMIDQEGSVEKAHEKVLTMFKAGETGLDFQDKIALEIMNKQESKELSDLHEELNTVYGLSPSLGTEDKVSSVIEKNIVGETVSFDDGKTENRYMDGQGNTLVVSKGKKGGISKITLNNKAVPFSRKDNLIQTMSKLNFKPLMNKVKGKMFIAKQDEKLYTSLPEENKVIIEDKNEISSIVDSDSLESSNLFNERKKEVYAKYDEKRKELVKKIKDRSELFKNVDELASKRIDFVNNATPETLDSLEQEMSKQGDNLNVLIKYQNNPKLSPEENANARVQKAKQVIQQLPFTDGGSKKFIKLSDDPQKSIEAYSILRNASFLAYTSYVVEDFDANVIPDMFYSVGDNYKESKIEMLEYTQLIDDSFGYSPVNKDLAQNFVDRINALHKKIYQTDKEIAKLVKDGDRYKISVLGYISDSNTSKQPLEFTAINSYFVTVFLDGKVVTIPFTKYIKYMEYQFYNKYDKTLSGKDTLVGEITKFPSEELLNEWETKKFAVIKTTVETFLRRNPILFNQLQKIDEPVILPNSNNNESIAMYYLNILRTNKYSNIISQASKSSSVSKLLNLFESPVSLVAMINNEEKVIEAPTVWHAILYSVEGIKEVDGSLNKQQILGLSNFNAREIVLKNNLTENSLYFFQNIIDNNWNVINTYKEAFEILRSTYGATSDVFDVMMDYVGTKQKILSNYEKVFNQNYIDQNNGKFKFTKNQLAQVLTLQALYPKQISLTDKKAEITFEESETSNFELNSFLNLKDNVLEIDADQHTNFDINALTNLTALYDLSQYKKITILESAKRMSEGRNIARVIKNLYPNLTVEVKRRQYPFTLNGEQQEALTTIKKALNSERTTTPSDYVLVGNAGTGKSTVIAQIIQEFVYEKLQLGVSARVIVATPTHKAMKVLQNFIKKLDPTILPYIDFYTVTQLKEETLDSSTNKFAEKINQKLRINLANTNGVFIDESSMLSMNDYKLVRAKTKAPMIFIGDDAQLRPVGSKTKSPIFDLPSATKLSLRTITRQNIDNPIIKKAQYIRENPLSDDYPKVDEISETGGIQFVDTETSIINVVTEALLAGKNAMALAFRNETANRLNEGIRNAFFDQVQDEDVVVGERLLFGGRIIGTKRDSDGNTKSELYNNGDLITVDSIKEDNKSVTVVMKKMSGDIFNMIEPLLKEYGIFGSFYPLTDEMGTITGMIFSFPSTHTIVSEGVEFNYLHESQSSVYKVLNTILTKAEQESKKIYAQKISYQQKNFELRNNPYIAVSTLLVEAFQNVLLSPKMKSLEYKTVRYGYAGTVHKSQGSTYDVIGIHEQDMEIIHKDTPKDQGQIEIAERKYTAYTRSSGMVYSFHSKSKTKTKFEREPFNYPHPHIASKASNKPVVTQTTEKGSEVLSEENKPVNEGKYQLNISSYEVGLGRKLSNFAKIPVEFNGKKYQSSEDVYQDTKKELPDLSDDNVLELMYNIMIAKLEQNPDIMEEIAIKGGTEILDNATHNLLKDGKTVKEDRWTGQDGLFMQALRAAYEYVQGQEEANAQGVDEDMVEFYSEFPVSEYEYDQIPKKEVIEEITEEEANETVEESVEETEMAIPESGSYMNFRNVLYLSSKKDTPENIKAQKLLRRVGDQGIKWGEVDIVIYDEDNITDEQRKTIQDMREFGTADAISLKAYNEFFENTKNTKLGNIEVVPVEKGYGKRTELNAKESIVTIAFYNNNSSPGEILTKKVAEKHGSTYVPVNFNTIVSEEELQNYAVVAYKAIYEKVVFSDTPIEEIAINIAGNGINLLKMSQESADRMVSTFMDYLMVMLDQDIMVKNGETINLINMPIKILTGMQDGIDQSGAKWALSRDVNLKVHIPSDYRTQKISGINKSFFSFWKSLLQEDKIQFKQTEESYVTPEQLYEDYMVKSEKISEWVDFVESAFQTTKIQVVDSNFVFPNGTKIGNAKGAYSLYTDTIYLNKDSIISKQDFYKQYAHELTHRFLVKMLSGKTKQVAFYNQILKLGNDLFDSLSQTELYLNNKAAFDIIFQYKDTNNDVFVNELVAHLMSGTSILRDYADDTEYTEGITFKQRFHNLIKTIVNLFTKAVGKKPTFQKALEELLSYNVNYKTPHSILEQAKITEQKNIPDGVLAALSTFHISDKSFNPVTLQNVALAIAEKNNEQITDHIEYLKKFSKEELKQQILSLNDYKTSLEILHKNSKTEASFGEYVDKKILSLYTRLANISLKKMVRMQKEPIYNDEGDIIEINGKPQYTIQVQSLPIVFEDFYGAKQSSYKENRVIERSVQMLSDYFGVPVEPIYLEQFWTKNNLDAYNVTPWSMIKNNEVVDQLYDDKYVWIGNFGALETTIMLNFPEGKPANFLEKINQAQSIMEANGKDLDFEEVESKFYTSSMIRWMIEDIRLGGVYSSKQQKSSLFTEGKSDAIKILKRAYDLSPEQKIALNQTEKRDLFDSTENKTGITYENGEILFNAFIFDSEDTNGTAEVTIGKEVITFNLKDILLNAFGKETTDGIIYYLAGGFDNIYRKGFGVDKEGPIKAWASNIGDMKPLFLKASYQGIYDPNDLIYQWMEQNNISVLVSSSSAKVNDYGKNDFAGLSSMEASNQTVQLPLTMFNRISEKDTIDKEAIGLSSGFTRNIYSQYNPIFGDNEFNIALSTVLERLSKKTQSKLTSFQGANIMDHLVKLLESESFSNLELTVSKMILSIINEESLVTNDIYVVLNDAQKIDQDAKRLEVYKKLSNIFNDPFFAQILQQYVKETLNDYFAYKMPSRNAVIRPDLGYLELSNVLQVVSNINTELNSELKDSWDLMNIKGSKEIIEKIKGLREKRSELKSKYAEQTKAIKKLKNDLTTANIIFEHKQLAEQIEAISKEIDDLKENDQAIKEYYQKRNKLKRERLNEIIEKESGRLNEGYALLSPEIANEMLGQQKLSSVKEVKDQNKVKEYEAKSTAELFHEILNTATNQYIFFTNQNIKGINLDKSDNQIISKFTLYGAKLGGKPLAKYKVDIFMSTFKEDKLKAYGEFKALWLKYIEENKEDFDLFMDLLDATVENGQSLPLISNAPAELSHAKILSEIINEIKDNQTDERDFTELNEEEAVEAVESLERQLGYEPVILIDNNKEVKRIHLNKKKSFVSFVNRLFGLKTIQVGQTVLNNGERAFAFIQANNDIVYMSADSQEAEILRKKLLDDLTVPFSKFEPQKLSNELRTLNKKLFRQKLIATAIPTDSAFSQRPLTIVGVSKNMDSSSAILDSKHWQTRAGKDFDIDTIHLTFRSAIWGKEFDQIIDKLEEANKKLVEQTKKVYKEVLGNESVKEESDIYDNANHIAYMQKLSSVNPKGANTRIGQNLFDLLDMFPKEVGMVIGTKTMFSTFSTMGGKSKFSLKIPFHINKLIAKVRSLKDINGKLDFDINSTDPNRVMKASIFFQRWLNDQVDKPTSVNSFHYNVTNGALFELKYGDNVLRVLEEEVSESENLTKEDKAQIFEYIESLNQGIETGLKFLYFNGFNQRNKRHSLDMKDDKDFSDYVNDLRQQQMINKMIDNKQFEELSLLVGKYVAEKQTYQRNVREDKNIVMEFVKNLSFEHTTDETPMIGIFNNINLGDIPQTMPGVWEYSTWMNNFKDVVVETIYQNKFIHIDKNKEQEEITYEDLLNKVRPVDRAFIKNPELARDLEYYRSTDLLYLIERGGKLPKTVREMQSLNWIQSLKAEIIATLRFRTEVLTGENFYWRNLANEKDILYRFFYNQGERKQTTVSYNDEVGHYILKNMGWAFEQISNSGAVIFRTPEHIISIATNSKVLSDSDFLVYKNNLNEEVLVMKEFAVPETNNELFITPTVDGKVIFTYKQIDNQGKLNTGTIENFKDLNGEILDRISKLAEMATLVTVKGQETEISIAKARELQEFFYKLSVLIDFARSIPAAAKIAKTVELIKKHDTKGKQTSLYLMLASLIGNPNATRGNSLNGVAYSQNAKTPFYRYPNNNSYWEVLSRVSPELTKRMMKDVSNIYPMDNFDKQQSILREFDEDGYVDLWFSETEKLPTKLNIYNYFVEGDEIKKRMGLWTAQDSYMEIIRVLRKDVFHTVQTPLDEAGNIDYTAELAQVPIYHNRKKGYKSVTFNNVINAYSGSEYGAPLKSYNPEMLIYAQVTEWQKIMRQNQFQRENQQNIQLDQALNTLSEVYKEGYFGRGKARERAYIETVRYTMTNNDDIIVEITNNGKSKFRLDDIDQTFYGTNQSYDSPKQLVNFLASQDKNMTKEEVFLLESSLYMRQKIALDIYYLENMIDFFKEKANEYSNVTNFYNYFTQIAIPSLEEELKVLQQPNFYPVYLSRADLKAYFAKLNNNIEYDKLVKILESKGIKDGIFLHKLVKIINNPFYNFSPNSMEISKLQFDPDFANFSKSNAKGLKKFQDKLYGHIQNEYLYSLWLDYVYKKSQYGKFIEINGESQFVSNYDEMIMGKMKTFLGLMSNHQHFARKIIPLSDVKAGDEVSFMYNYQIVDEVTQEMKIIQIPVYGIVDKVVGTRIYTQRVQKKIQVPKELQPEFESDNPISLDEAIGKVIQVHERMIEMGVDRPMTDNQKQFIIDLISDGYLEEELLVILDALDMAQASAYISQAYQTKLIDLFGEDGFETVNIEAPVIEQGEGVTGYKSKAVMEDVITQEEKLQKSGYVMLMNRRSPIAEKANLGFKVMLLVQSGLMLGGFKISNWMDGTASLMSDLSLVPHAQVFSQYSNMPKGRQSKRSLNNLLSSADNIETYRDFLDDNEIDTRVLSEARLAELIAYKYCISNDIGVQGVTGAMIKEYENEGIIEKLGVVNKVLLWSFRRQEEAIRKKGAFYYAYKAIHIDGVTNIEEIEQIVDKGVSRTQSMYEAMYRRLAENKDIFKWLVQFSQYGHYQYELFKIDKDISKEIGEKFDVSLLLKSLIFGETSVNPNRKVKYAKRFITDVFFYWGMGILMPGLRTGHPLSRMIMLALKLSAGYAIAGYDDDDKKRGWMDLFYALSSVAFGAGLTIPIGWLANKLWVTNKEEIMAMNDNNRSNMGLNFNAIQAGKVIYNIAVEPLLVDPIEKQSNELYGSTMQDQAKIWSTISYSTAKIFGLNFGGYPSSYFKGKEQTIRNMPIWERVQLLIDPKALEDLTWNYFNPNWVNFKDPTFMSNAQKQEERTELAIEYPEVELKRKIVNQQSTYIEKLVNDRDNLAYWKKDTKYLDSLIAVQKNRLDSLQDAPLEKFK